MASGVMPAKVVHSVPAASRAVGPTGSGLPATFSPPGPAAVSDHSGVPAAGAARSSRAVWPGVRVHNLFKRLHGPLGVEGVTEEVKTQDLALVRLMGQRLRGRQALARLKDVRAIMRRFPLSGRSSGTVRGVWASWTASGTTPGQEAGGRCAVVRPSA